MSDFTTVLKERRSATKFQLGVELADAELDAIFQLVKFTPSAFNLQHAHYVVVKDEVVKEKVYEAAYKQYKIKTASAVILVLGNMDAYQEVATINEGLLNLGVLSKQEYDQTVDSVTSFYETRGETFKREEAIRNASLSAMSFMLAAKDRGWDTCPMIGFDPKAMSEVLNVPDRYVPAMLITIGKEDISAQRPRGYRKPVGEFVSRDTF
ncbi:nitroreductase family protein [Paenibacillus sp. GSMTC-2017]|uniref:nitroreductase family protein n=1 Tax=Paenibacillus sp. GSMTC-2017 TaxID=2794350 RepID=UPI0018D9F2CC|nr:nitroreductase family protein [Paenibacillus sp. GSMTC-2017]MBH5320434.1 nitroreductase family protein [Paenibacillus sp. GSMTC-2017]